MAGLQDHADLVEGLGTNGRSLAPARFKTLVFMVFNLDSGTPETEWAAATQHGGEIARRRAPCRDGIGGHAGERGSRML